MFFAFGSDAEKCMPNADTQLERIVVFARTQETRFLTTSTAITFSYDVDDDDDDDSEQPFCVRQISFLLAFALRRNQIEVNDSD